MREPPQTKLIEFIRAHKVDFAWTSHDIPVIDLSIMMNKLNMDQKAKPVKQKIRSFNPERYAEINTEVDKLIEAGSIREVHYPEQITNVVLVKKAKGK